MKCFLFDSYKKNFDILGSDIGICTWYLQTTDLSMCTYSYKV